MNNVTAQRIRPFLVGLFLAAAIVSVFWLVQHHGFLWDDRANIAENPVVASSSLSEIGRLWTSPYKKLYIPLTYTVWAVIAKFSVLPAPEGGEPQLDPTLFHLANVVVHWLSAIVVFTILRRLVKKDWAAACGALLFAIHPVQVEPVAWATGMKDVLSGLFSLVALWQYLQYAGWPSGVNGRAEIGKLSVQENKVSPGRKALHYAVATLAFVFALLSKPAAVAVPAMAWVLDCCLVQRPARCWAPPLTLWIMIAAPVVLLTKWEQPDIVIDSVPAVWDRPLIAGDALAFYVYKLFLPLWLAPDYGRSPAVVLQHGWYLWTWVIPLGVAALAWHWRKRQPWLIVSAALFVAALLPVLGFVPFNFQNFSTVADRYLYLALLGPALSLSYFMAANSERRGIIICALALSILATRSALQTRHWTDGLILFRHVLQVNPDSWTAHYILGNALERRNELDEAIHHYRQALKIAPNYARAHNNLGIALERRSDLEEAADHYRLALSVDPDLAEAHLNLGSALARRGELDQAIVHFRAAVRSQPDFVDAHRALSRALALQGKHDDAIEHMEKALKTLRSRERSDLVGGP
jgi:tetratricopeptide (TPR) repeat protein